MAAMTPEALQTVIEETITIYRAQVEGWLVRKPGAWGFLAGRGVLAARQRLGRRLEDAERRAVWSALWAELQAIETQRAREP